MKFECWLGTKVWSAQTGDSASAYDCLLRISTEWNWLNPWESLKHSIEVLASAPEALGPVTLGAVYAGMVGAAIAYPFGAVVSSEYYAYRLRRRARRGMQIMPPRGRLDIPSAPGKADGDNMHYVLRPESCIQADSVALLFDGRQAYPEMLRAIQEAKESIDLETYILRDDKTGRRFAEALAAAARRGVRTRLLFDAVGALGLPAAYIARVTDAGVKAAIFRPLSSVLQRGLMPLNRRDHRKIMIVDHRIGFIGGLNICDDNAPKEDGGMGWRDTHMRIDGAVIAAKMQDVFEETWALADVFPSPAKPLLEETIVTSDTFEADCTPAKIESVSVQILGNKEFLQRVRLRRAYLHAIRHAQRYILIENAYFIPDRGIRRALYKAVKRGVTVAAVVAMYSDVKVAALASRSLYSELLSGGVKLFEYPISMMHSKVAVVDDVWSMVGSYNLDHRSLMHNLEAGVMTVDSRVARALRERIISDIERSREITRDFHNARPWDNVLLEAMAYQIRYWL
jgi:cardiolipin synthase